MLEHVRLELVAAARDHQVDGPAGSTSSSSSARSVPSEGDRVLGSPASMTAPWTTSARMRLECFAGAAAAQDDGVAGLEAERGGVDRDVRPRLVDDGDDAQRDADTCAGRPRWRASSPSTTSPQDRAGPRGRARRRPSRARGPRRGADGRRARRAAGRARQPDVVGVLAQDLGGAPLERLGHRLERLVLALAREHGERARRALRRAADVCDAHGSSLPPRAGPSRCTASGGYATRSRRPAAGPRLTLTRTPEWSRRRGPCRRGPRRHDAAPGRRPARAMTSCR